MKKYSPVAKHLAPGRTHKYLILPYPAPGLSQVQLTSDNYAGYNAIVLHVLDDPPLYANPLKNALVLYILR
jgi:hypothetical protein